MGSPQQRKLRSEIAPAKLTRAPMWLVSLGLALALSLGLAAALASALDARAQTSSYIYTVRPGDSWGTVAEQTGVSVEALQEANPDKVRDTEWLLEGDELVVPVASSAPRREHEVQLGESWNSIANRYNVPVRLLQAANPRSVRAGLLLYRGERLVIPPPPTPTTGVENGDVEDEVADVSATPAPTATATITSDAEMTLTVEIPDLSAADTITDTEILTDTEAVTDTAAVAEMEEATDEAEPVEAETLAEDADTDEAEAGIVEDDESDAGSAEGAPACPTRFLDFPQAMTAALNSDPEIGVDTLRAFLETCEALVAGGFVIEDLTGNDVDDVVVIYQNPSVETIFVESDLAIFNGREDGYTLAYRARAAGDVRLLAVDDINEDGQLDVAWIDTTCGASTCFDTFNVRSWTGSLWADWTEGTITMAYAAIELADYDDVDINIDIDVNVALDGDADDAEASVTLGGQAIILQGGIYGSVGAGPQRSRTEVWGSVGGAPYALLAREYAASDCLYHVVIDANAAFLNGWADDFAQAERLYRQAATDAGLMTCWVRADEEDELRSFSLFRLALIAGYRDDLEAAAEQAEAAIEAYPDEIYEAVAAIWLREYRNLGGAAEACEVVTQFAELTDATWEILANYGYTNPSFQAADVCPILSPPEPADDVEENGASEEEEAAEDTEVLEETDEEAAASSSELAAAPEDALAAFPECPQDLSGYGTTLLAVLEAAGNDEDLIEAWMTGCRALSETRGAFILIDMTGDGLTDAAFFPVLVTDLGFGPDGAQGATLIYHGADDGGFTLVASPEIYGQPEPLAIGDLNDNGQIEVAWTVTGCSTFCVTEVQMWSWDGEAYVPAILPGATMANAEVSFEPLMPDDAEAGQRLILYGGVSGAPDGGLETPHWEEWQSLDGAAYQRVRWEYDRAVEGNACMGLRLIEADVALQAAQQVGYAGAIDLYADALADLAEGELAACSLMGMEADEELALLQGLATFRLIQAHALAGEMEDAAARLADLEAEGPETGYVDVARTWWDAFSAAENGDPLAAAEACAQVLPIVEEEPVLWQVTDQYGYNHPVLAAEQICFTP